MSARKVPLYKKFLEPADGPVPVLFPIPACELAKMDVIAELLPVHPEAQVFTATSLTEYVNTLDDVACMQFLAALQVMAEPAKQPNRQN